MLKDEDSVSIQNTPTMMSQIGIPRIDEIKMTEESEDAEEEYRPDDRLINS